MAESYSRETPLTVAILKQKIEVAHLLLTRTDLGINAERNGGYAALFLAFYCDDTAILELLLATGRCDFRQKFVLWSLVYSMWHCRRERALKVLLDIGQAGLNILTPKNEALFILAVDFGKVDMPKFILSRGKTDVNAQDDLGRTALHRTVIGCCGANKAKSKLWRWK